MDKWRADRQQPDDDGVPVQVRPDLVQWRCRVALLGISGVVRACVVPPSPLPGPLVRSGGGKLALVVLCLILL